MRLTSKRDMISGAVVAGAGLMFHLGATFGQDPPGWLFDVHGARNVSARRPSVVRPSEAPSPIIVARFLDQPAPISDVSVRDRLAGARINLHLGPGTVDPRFSLSRRGGVHQLRVEGLGALTTASGSGKGIVEHWSLGSGGKSAAVFSLKRAARLDRVFLNDTAGADRYLVLDLADACPVSTLHAG